MRRALLIACVCAAAGCATEIEVGYVEVDLGLPQHFPQPTAPANNPLTEASIELGRHLFYDTRLSVNDSLACANCHKQEFAFAVDTPVSQGATGDIGVLNAPSLANVIYAQPLTWAHGDIASIEDQLIGPMFGDSPLEMGMAGKEESIVARLASDERYVHLFGEAYPERGIDLEVTRLALASFARSLVSHRSRFDEFVAGDSSALSASAVRGSELFYSARLGCSHCHAGFAFTTAVRSTATAGSVTSPFHNVGLYNVDGNGGYPSSAQGLIGSTGFEKDMGRFRVPSLRNVGLTAPYGHDGSVATLEAFIRIYEEGGRNLESGPHAGDGRENQWRSRNLKDFELSDEERDDLIAFLHSLSDQGFVTDPDFSSPW